MLLFFAHRGVLLIWIIEGQETAVSVVGAGQVVCYHAEQNASSVSVTEHYYNKATCTTQMNDITR